MPPPVENPPPCNFILLTVTLITTQSGVLPDANALICKAFSAPISAPKPASVTTYSEHESAKESAMIEELP